MNVKNNTTKRKCRNNEAKIQYNKSISNTKLKYNTTQTPPNEAKIQYNKINASKMKPKYNTRKTPQK